MAYVFNISNNGLCIQYIIYGFCIIYWYFHPIRRVNVLRPVEWLFSPAESVLVTGLLRCCNCQFRALPCGQKRLPSLSRNLGYITTKTIKKTLPDAKHNYKQIYVDNNENCSKTLRRQQIQLCKRSYKTNSHIVV